VTPLENPLQLRANRKVIARLQTELTARKVAEASKAQGVDR
jgi:ribosomal protein L29